MAALCRIKSKSKRHPVLAKGCLVPEEDGDTDGTEIYDPDDDDDRGGPRKQRRPSKGSKRKGAPPARGAKRGPRAKAPPRPPPSAAQYSGLVQVSAAGTPGSVHAGPCCLRQQSGRCCSRGFVGGGARCGA